MPTVKDVASRANVSPGTVSNVLTKKRPVSVATRARVLQAIEELGYQPNALARGLINRRSETIAVVASGLDYFGPSQIVVGIERAADERGYSLLLRLIHWSDPREAEHALATLAGRQVDGIIWAAPEIGDNRARLMPERLAKAPPIVFINMAPRPGMTSISIDNRRGARQAVEHLIAQGRRTIGLITGPLDWWEARERQAGWHEALDAAGLRADPALVAIGDWSTVSGEEGLRCLLARVPELDAIFVSNDQMALGALRTAHLSARKVPEDLAVVGFDDLPESTCFWPPLTTMHQPLLDLGRRAVHLLNEMMEERAAAKTPHARSVPCLDAELIVRESSVKVEAEAARHAPCAGQQHVQIV
ncbi:MAG: Lactose operon repressor [Chloroflexi bacterium ADurb.Bin325]|nr:MAG: Lactose operon repressor [Chloroflexi bacterium ADurb.Bin325]